MIINKILKHFIYYIDGIYNFNFNYLLHINNNYNIY